MTPEQLTQLGIDPQKWYTPLIDMFARYNINTTQRQASFIGQCQHESNNFRTLEENLHYSADGLMRTWPSRFPTIDVAEKYANNPEKIANKVYAGRLGNGDEESGEGAFYFGRGLIQLTGKENYDRCGKAIGFDFVNKPQLLVEPYYASLSAGWFWNKLGLNDLADAQEYGQMTKRINGGTLGLDDRIVKITKAKEILG
jgi:putative chitinase